jgi:lambda family phage portal protein
MMQLFKRKSQPVIRRNSQAGTAVAVRGFAAAQTDRLLAGWQWDGGFSSHEIRSQLASIRARSREMEKNSPAFKRWLDLRAINIVGDGFRLKSMPHDGIPGSKNYKLDQEAARFIEWHFWQWCNGRDPETRRTYCDATGRKTMNQIDALNARTEARDGEYFMLPVVADNPYGMALRIIRPDACDETYNREATATENPIFCGVEIDRTSGAPLAYYFHTTNPESGIRNRAGRPLVRIPSHRVIHGFETRDEDQPRGIPGGHAALIKLKMLDELDRAELTAARDEACSVRTYTAASDDPDGALDLTDPANRAIASALVADKEPGQSEVLPPGWKSEVTVPQHPNGNHGAFKAGMNKDVASAFGVEYSNAFNDWAGVSFSSVRVGTISERDMWIMQQNRMIDQSKTPVFLIWLRSFLSLSVSGNLPMSKIAKFSEHEYRGRRWMWVDPMRDMAAAVVAVDRKWKTNTAIASDLGTDFDDNVEESRREQITLAGDEKQSVPTLNGAQITASLAITQSYALGEIGKEGAIALLTAAGVPTDAAQNMINSQAVAPPQEGDGYEDQSEK